MFYIVYPEEKWVDEKQIESWYKDAYANNEIDEFVEFAYERNSTDPMIQAKVLDCIGHITLNLEKTKLRN